MLMKLFEMMKNVLGINQDEKAPARVGAFKQKGLSALEPKDGKGLPRDTTKGDGSMFDIDSFVDTMGQWEGTEDHQSQEQGTGELTYGYGILPKTAKQFGVEYSPESDRRENAKQVYSKMLDKIKQEAPEINFDELGSEMSTAVLSTYINLGSFSQAPTLVNALKEGDIEKAKDSLFLYQTLTKGGKRYSSKGLIARRAKEYNLFVRAEGGTEFVDEVAVEGSKEKPVYVLKNREGKEIKRIESKYPLAPDNSMKSVAVPTNKVA